MIAHEDVENARRWLIDNCHHAHIRATLGRGLSYVHALESAGLNVESIDGRELREFLAEAAESPAFRHHFVQPEL